MVQHQVAPGVEALSRARSRKLAKPWKMCAEKFVEGRVTKKSIVNLENINRATLESEEIIFAAREGVEEEEAGSKPEVAFRAGEFEGVRELEYSSASTGEDGAAHFAGDKVGREGVVELFVDAEDAEDEKFFASDGLGAENDGRHGVVAVQKYRYENAMCIKKDICFVVSIFGRFLSFVCVY